MTGRVLARLGIETLGLIDKIPASEDHDLLILPRLLEGRMNVHGGKS